MDRWLGLLAAWLVAQFFFQFVLPAVMAKGNWASSPWPWLAFLHAMVALVWLTDLRKLVRRTDVDHIVRLLAWLGAALSTLMLLQWIGLDPVMKLVQLKFGKISWLHENHMIGLMGNSFQASACLAPLIPAMAYQRKRWGWAATTLLSLWVLWLAGSKAGFAAALVGSLFSAGLIRTRARLILLILLGLLAGAWAIHSLDLARHQIWTQTLALIQQHPLLGHGLGMFKELGVVTAPNNTYSVWWAHNEWLHFSSELGIPWTLCLAAFLLRETFKLSRVHWALCGQLVSILILSLFSIPFHLAPTLAMTGICLISSNLEPNTKELNP